MIGKNGNWARMDILSFDFKPTLRLTVTISANYNRKLLLIP